jgi:hypothetical protein
MRASAFTEISTVGSSHNPRTIGSALDALFARLVISAPFFDRLDAIVISLPVLDETGAIAAAR